MKSLQTNQKTFRVFGEPVTIFVGGEGLNQTLAVLL